MSNAFNGNLRGRVRPLKDSSVHGSARVTVGLLSLLVIACQQTPTLIDYPESAPMREEHPQKALPPPMAVVGVLGEDVVVAYPVKSVWDPSVILQLRKVRVSVENVLRGDIAASLITVFYFTFGMTVDGGRILSRWKPGDRMLLFIRRDAGVFRMACDGFASCAKPVLTGAHRNLPTADERTQLMVPLAEILLTRGAGISDAEFVEGLGNGINLYAFMYLSDSDKAATKLLLAKMRLLESDPNLEVRKIACIEIQGQFKLKCANDFGEEDNENRDTADPAGVAIFGRYPRPKPKPIR